MNGYVFLIIAIILEVISTSMMKLSAGFTKLLPSIIVLVGICSSFFAMSKALTSVPLGIAYAIWSGVGTALTTLIAVFVWKEQLNLYTIVGILLIIAGVTLLNLKGHS